MFLNYSRNKAIQMSLRQPFYKNKLQNIKQNFFARYSVFEKSSFKNLLNYTKNKIY